MASLWQKEVSCIQWNPDANGNADGNGLDCPMSTSTLVKCNESPTSLTLGVVSGGDDLSGEAECFPQETGLQGAGHQSLFIAYPIAHMSWSDVQDQGLDCKHEPQPCRADQIIVLTILPLGWPQIGPFRSSISESCTKGI